MHIYRLTINFDQMYKMKTINFLLVITLLISCKKNEPLETKNKSNFYISRIDTLAYPANDYVNINCIEQIQPHGGDYDITTINTTDKLERIQYLMQRNNLDFSKWLYFNYDQSIVRGMQFYNDLPVFTSNVVYLFDTNDNLTTTNNLSLVSSITLNTTPNLNTDYLLNLYNYYLSHDKDYAAFKNITCLTAEFGYYNLNSGAGNAPENITKAWKIFPKGKGYIEQLPVLYVNDSDGKKIYYFNGIYHVII